MNRALLGYMGGLLDLSTSTKDAYKVWLLRKKIEKVVVESEVD